MMTPRHPTPTPESPQGGNGHDRIFDDPRHDPYQAKGKYRAPIVCARCGAVFDHGRWRWGEAPAGARRSTCPACARVRDELPAGFVTLSGNFFDLHRAELLELARHTAELERSEHPMRRIMHIVETPAQTVITTSDIHSARRIGEALESAYHGELAMCLGEDEYYVRVTWRR